MYQIQCTVGHASEAASSLTVSLKYVAKEEEEERKRGIDEEEIGTHANKNENIM